MQQPHLIIEPPQGIRKTINSAYRMPEKAIVEQYIAAATLDDNVVNNIKAEAINLVKALRSAQQKAHRIDVFLAEYSLSTDEGIALMCLAEALLRIPDKVTIDKLIKDKFMQGNWQEHLGKNDSLFINATTFALMLTGKILSPEKANSILTKTLYNFLGKSSASIIRASTEKAMHIMGNQFVMGRTIQEALQNVNPNYAYSFDMLGEAAITLEDAERYFNAYYAAIEAIGASIKVNANVYTNPGISIKLSALHPRYQEAKSARVLNELVPKLLALAQTAKKYQMGLTIDAEEAERLDLSLDVIESVYTNKALADWNGFGLAIQSYQKRAFAVIDFIEELASKQQKRMMVRLIKGAYWDTEIKRTQMLGLKDYPVFTHKVFTDVAFQACAKKLLTLTDVIYPQFATHNAYTVAMILELYSSNNQFEFQALYGMGQELYKNITQERKIPCRIYAPVGKHEDLLPYLVRRILENGANSSFVNRIVEKNTPLEDLVVDPINAAKESLTKINQNIPLPTNIFAPIRINSSGIDLSDREEVAKLYAQIQAINKETLGNVVATKEEDIEPQVAETLAGFMLWKQKNVQERAKCLLELANLYEKHQVNLIYILIKEAGKTLPDCIAEVREAIDFCRYYAYSAVKLMQTPTEFYGYTGEKNTLSLHPRGVLVCISPWNFPLAIFTGQVVAALVTGNTVIAKPAAQTPLIADYAVNLMYKAGIPRQALKCLFGDREIGARLTQNQHIKGVIFTGSTKTAHLIALALTQKSNEIVPLIAETGGLNTMLVDSSALLEQVANDVISSAFGSAGQRCSALRVLYIQEEVFLRCIKLIKGAMQELSIGDPFYLATDIGPIIDKAALLALQEHVANMQKSFPILYQCQLKDEAKEGNFMPPTMIKINAISDLNGEVFGPILHVISYKSSELNKIIEDINNTGYGLTCGIHSRIQATVDFIHNKLKAGNCYVNRNMIGAVVGLQPFGGEGLSGTGPKAGGPNYLSRLCVERTLTIDTTAAGGNASLLNTKD
ncbi:MAG: bifunctional proline dehydrogenase/L-glutamate gamma-semialdehyde dehydrogenase [Legionellales bacterium RIFCSPHIGHO2_12_FULL_37_14]|nr:MAG: bifunctional proline dehydrogenase/L-glutamate gamma-semialdehyde dehydrogenase [Legionellales bacterium RIFCSPHIGHO2_12_FULL_37_14]